MLAVTCINSICLLSQAVAYKSTPPVLVALWVLIAIILLTCLCIFGYILINRFLKTRFSIQRKLMRLQVQEKLSLFLFDDSPLDSASLGELFSEIHFRSPIARKIIRREILGLHQSLSGESALRLESLFGFLDYDKEALLKLKSFSWRKMAGGMHDLAQMNFKDTTRALEPLINHSNPDVRMQAQMAVIHLEPKRVERFLGMAVYPLNDWEQLNLYKTLADLNVQDQPVFSNWFQSPNDSIVVFSLRMCGLFNQMAPALDLLNLIKHPSPLIQTEAIRTIGLLGVTEAEPVLLDLLLQATDPIKLDILKTLAKIGTSASAERLKEFVYLGDFDVRLGACKALIALSQTGFLKEELAKPDGDELLRALIKHALDKRLK
jgi:hypothetical protein